MEKLPGTQYRSIADNMAMEDKLAIAGTIAVWVDQLSRRIYDTIGSFYSDQSGNLELGHPVIQQFMGDWRHEYHFERGPFDNFCSYIRSFVDCVGAELFDRRQHLRAIIDAIEDRIGMLDESSDGKSGVLELLNEARLALARREVKDVSSIDFGTIRYRLADPDGRSHNDFTFRSRRLSRLSDLVDTISLKPFDQGSTILFH